METTSDGMDRAGGGCCAAGPGTAGAHTQALPSCSGLPTATDFYNGEDVTAEIVVGTPAPDIATAPGTGESGRGNERYRYAKIIVPPLAAGELRVFSTTSSPIEPTDAVLCHNGRSRASYKTSYDAAHTREERAALNARTWAQDARDAVTKAEEIRDDVPATLTGDDLTARQERQREAAERHARGALTTVAERLTTIAGNLQTAGLGTRATSQEAGTGQAALAEATAETAGNAARASTHADAPDTQVDDNPADEITALGVAANALYNPTPDPSTGFAADLEAEAIAKDPHENFKLRATVNSGDREFILVVVQSDPSTPAQNVVPATDADPPVPTAPTLALQFHGVLSADPPHGRIAKEDDAETHTLTVTAPGLLTVTASGSGNMKGALGGVQDAQAGGSGSNFTLAVPVATSATTYPLTVTSQTRAAIRYDLTVTFAVAMGQADITDVIDGEDAPTWTNTGIDNDDPAAGTPVQIARRPEDGNQADTDVFVFQPSSNGLLEVHGADGTTGSPSDTQAVLYGPLGEIDTSTDRMPSGRHFGFENIPVKSGNRYAVVVTGTDGTYSVAFDLDPITGTAISDGTDDFGGTATTVPLTPDAAAKKMRHRYLFNIEHRGTLYLESEGSHDPRATLYGPDGKIVKSDSDSGEGRNFRIAAAVTPGLYMLEVESQTRAAVTYTLTANFARGVIDDEPGDDTIDPGDDEDDREPDDTGGMTQPGALNQTGSLDEPAPNSFRSGIGILRGWVCNAGTRGVQIRLTNTRTNSVTRITAPNGTDRGDVDTQRLCGSRASSVGFAVQFNYNLLPAGEYTAEAWIGTGRSEERIGLDEEGQTNTFEIVRIAEDEFLTDAELGLGPDDDPIECEVPNFPPNTRQRVILGWDEASQNFQIVDTE